MRQLIKITTAALALTTGGGLFGQSSSLFVGGNPPQRRPAMVNGVQDNLSPYISQTSISAVRLPEPRQFAMHDLVTIIVRESVEAGSESTLDTQKDTTLNGTISAFPSIRLKDLANFQLQPSSMDDGNPQVNLNMSKEFQGEGEYERKDSFTTRITARIIDIKPNGSLVLEARKFIQSEDETVNVVLTGTCRTEDITVDNTILSTQVYDLRLVKDHKGELRGATKKGLITKFFEFLFNF